MTVSGWIAARLLSAQEHERALVSAEIEDELTEPLTSALARLRVLQVLSDDRALRTELEEIHRAISAALTTLRCVTHDLGPAHLREVGFPRALEMSLAHALEGSDIEHHLSIAVSDLPSTIGVALCRVAHEALTNVVRHAQATRVDVRVDRLGSAIRLTIEDDGRGVPAGPAELGAGIPAMRGRIELVGGCLDLQSRPGRGVRVAAVIPDAL